MARITILQEVMAIMLMALVVFSSFAGEGNDEEGAIAVSPVVAAGRQRELVSEPATGALLSSKTGSSPRQVFIGEIGWA
jgi:hypothetical protein